MLQGLRRRAQKLAFDATSPDFTALEGLTVWMTPQCILTFCICVDDGTVFRLLTLTPTDGWRDLPDPEVVWEAAEILGFVGLRQHCDIELDPDRMMVKLVQQVSVSAVGHA